MVKPFKIHVTEVLLYANVRDHTGSMARSRNFTGSVTSDGVNAVRLRRQHIRAPAGVYLSFSNVSV